MTPGGLPSKSPGRIPDLHPVAARGGSWTSRHSWAAAAAALVVAGVIASVFAGTSVARGDAGTSRKAFERSAADVASTLQLAIQRENDLVVDAGAYAVDDPTGSQGAFAKWTTSAQVWARYPELESMAVLSLVPAGDLAAFGAAHAIDPARPFTVSPPGARPYYCLAVGQVGRLASGTANLEFDACAGDHGSLMASRDSGLGSYDPIQVGAHSWLGYQIPMYANGAVPATIAARRAAFVGWVATLVDPAVVLNRALQSSADLSVTMRQLYLGQSDVAFTSGRAPSRGRSLTTVVGNGWTVTTVGPVATGGALADRSALELLITGIVLSVLLGSLMFILATSRERARRLVEERTGQLRHQALHDALTGLPNRALVMDRIAQLLARNRRYGTEGAVLFMDLDDFKNVNDTLGHQAGDQLLVAVATRLVGALREVDTTARMGGDEFVVLIDGTPPHQGPKLVAQRLLDVMRQPFELGASSLPLTVNISIGIATGDRPDAGDLLRDADVALYQAKRQGKNRYEIFDPAMQTSISQRTVLEFDLRSALAAHQFQLVYQPIYTLDDLTVIGVEALLRWEHPTLGLILPDEFIPILEQTGQISAVGRWVLQAACSQMAAWHLQGDTLDVSVNVSARQLDDDAIINDIRDALHDSGLPAASLIIEVTETALMRDADATAERLRAIKALGVRIAVDDFGTGYSSLAYLRKFPVDSLKIDRTFTNAVTTSPESKALIRTLVQLGKDLGLQTLAEGVETTNEMDLLRGAHVDQAQGFLMARPLDPETLETQLLIPTRTHTPSDTPPLSSAQAEDQGG